MPFADQALLLALRGAEQAAVMQAIWVYRHPVDLDGVRRFHQTLGHGLVARLIERSPVPFGRHRWVSVPGPQTALDVGEHPRPREEFYQWADDQVELPLDPERGPGWRMGVQLFTDGTTGISLVISHAVADGGAAVFSILDTISGGEQNLDYPAPHSRPRRRAVIEDLHQTLADLPETARTLVKAAKVAVARRHELVGPKPPVPASAGDERVVLPTAVAAIDIDEWDSRAETLGGNRLSLVAGFAGKLAENLGRTRPEDGAATLMVPVSERFTLEDTGGNMVTIANIRVDPEPVTKDLSGLRTAIKQGLAAARETPDEMVELLPLIPFLPKRAMRAMADMTFGFSSDMPVTCSNLGEVPEYLLLADGTPADSMWFRGVDRNVKRSVLERRGGLLTVISARLADKMLVSVISYQPGAENTIASLREVIGQTLAQFDLSGVIE